MHLRKRHVGPTGDVQHHCAGAFYVGLHQRAGDSGVGRLRSTIFTGGFADTHHGGASVGHDRTHVGEVEVDQAWYDDDFTYPLDTLLQGSVGHAEGLLQGHIALGDSQQPVVWDDDESVYVCFEPGDAFIGQTGTFAAFDGEGLGDYSHGQSAHVLGDLGHYRTGAGAGTSTHSAGNENHVSAIESHHDILMAFLGCSFAQIRIASGTQSARQLLADL